MRVDAPRVLFSDASWLALEKPAAMLTTPPSTRGPTLVDVARSLRPKATHHHPLTRLDAGVTGVVLFALDAEAIALAERARAAGQYRRLYVGITAPPPVEPYGSWNAPIAVDPSDVTRRTTGAGAERRAACTLYATLARGEGAALVGFAPLTGRTHQIRVHASAAGNPLFGDLAYGGARRLVADDGAVCDARRVMLHAWRVRVPQGRAVIESPIADDLWAAWRGAGGEGLAGRELPARLGEALTSAFAGE